MRVLLVLVSSLLLGFVVVGGIGGIVYPPVLKVAEPLLCRTGVYEIDRTGKVYCTDEKAAQTRDGLASLVPKGFGNSFDNAAGDVMDNGGYRTDITLKAILVAGIIYSAVAMMLLSLVALAIPRRR